MKTIIFATLLFGKEVTIEYLSWGFYAAVALFCIWAVFAAFFWLLGILFDGMRSIANWLNPPPPPWFAAFERDVIGGEH